MNNRDSKIEQHLLDILYSLEGKINKTQFRKIVKFYNWQFQFKSIHIVGTNGKGSNAKYINDELIAQSYTVGLFTSPHIYSMYERIKINNKNIDFEIMAKFISKLKSDFIDVNFGWFDVFFLTALHWFNSQKIDVTIFEAGIGAKKDIVNYLDHNYLLITSIAVDHEKILGDSIEKIAIDKSYSIKNHNQVFVSDSIDKKIVNIFKEKANKENCIFSIIKTNQSTYETINQSLSKAFLKQVFCIDKFKSHFILPSGRSENIKINKIDCWVDVAHNYQGFFESLKYYQYKEINFEQIVVSLSSDKNNKKIFELLEKKFKMIYVYQNKGRKPLLLTKYSDKFTKILNIDLFLEKLDKKTLFIGSFYLVSEILNKIKGDNYNNN